MKAPLQEEARHKTVKEDDLLTLRKKKKNSHPHASCAHLVRASGDPRFMFVVYGLDLIVKVWFVFTVVALEVPCLFLWFY
jgi:hypothetical protein